MFGSAFPGNLHYLFIQPNNVLVIQLQYLIMCSFIIIIITKRTKSNIIHLCPVFIVVYTQELLRSQRRLFIRVRIKVQLNVLVKYMLYVLLIFANRFQNRIRAEK